MIFILVRNVANTTHKADRCQASLVTADKIATCEVAKYARDKR